MSNFNCYELRDKHTIKSIKEELDFYEKCKFCSQMNPLSDYIVYLKTRIGIQEINKPYDAKLIGRIDSRTGNTYNIQKYNKEQYSKNMDIMMYSKPWDKLKEFHKIVKINEFIDGLVYSKNKSKSKILENKEFLKLELSNGIKNKLFKKDKNMVVYDIEKMAITSIDCLFEEKGIYQIEWN